MSMKRYWFELLDESYNDLGAMIPDGSNKQTAINCAKRWMRDNGVTTAHLSVNSMRTSDILDMIVIEL